jgi:glycosyltransferase involved in cell wall biosynthesis
MIRYQVPMYDHPLMEDAWVTIRKWIPRGGVRIVADSKLLARDLNAFGIPEVTVVSVPSGGQFAGPIAEVTHSGPFTVTSLGSPRQEKGFLEILEAARILELEEPSIRFLLQANDPSDDVKRQLERFRLSPTANVKFIDKIMNSADYTKFIEAADVVLLPYSDGIYAARTSSALVESAAAGKPVVVSRRSWLDDFCDDFRIGVTCEFGDAQDLARAISQSRRDLANLRSLAVAAAPEVRQQHNAHELMGQLVAVREQVDATVRPTVLIVFPWAAEDVKSSGSGARLRSLIAEVEQSGMRAEVICFGYVEARLGEFSSVRVFKTLFWTICDEQAQVPGIDQMTGDRRLHLRMHLMSADNAPLIEEIRSAALGCVAVIVEHTHLAVATRKAVEGLDLKVAVIANDFIHEPALADGADPVVMVQVKALQSGDSAVAVAAKDAERFEKVGVACRLSKNPPQPKTLPRPNSALTKEILARWLPDVEPGTFIMFVGSAYEPNRVAAKVLEAAALSLRSRLKTKAPTVVIAGSAADPMQFENLVSLGVIPRVVLEALYDTCLVVAIPLFSGSGTSVKTIEAIDRGCPVLTTVSGARGLDDLRANFQIVKCDESTAAVAFADAYIAKSATLTAQRKSATDDNTRSYAKAGFKDVLTAIVPGGVKKSNAPVFDAELVDELLDYARFEHSDAAFLQAVDIAGDAKVSRDTALRALAAATALRRIEFTPALVGFVAHPVSLREVREQVYGNRSVQRAHVDPTAIARLDALGLRATSTEGAGHE